MLYKEFSFPVLFIHKQRHVPKLSLYFVLFQYFLTDILFQDAQHMTLGLAEHP